MTKAGEKKTARPAKSPVLKKKTSEETLEAVANMPPTSPVSKKKTSEGAVPAKPKKSPVSKKKTSEGAVPANPVKSPVSKKKTDEGISEGEDWAVDEFAKDLEYFHEVIGLPNVGKIPKDISADDVPLAELEKHFGVKAKNDKNGYKKEGVKGIPAEEIANLVLALDGIDKFQLFSLEIARGLYYERILKKAVNWAACGVDKHKGQLAWRLRRNAPAQVDLPPWKRVEHKYNMKPSLGLKITDQAEEQYLYSAAERPSELQGLNSGKESTDVGSEMNEANEQVILDKLDNGKEESDVDKVASDMEMGNEQENENEDPNEGWEAGSGSSDTEMNKEQLQIVAFVSTPTMPSEPVIAIDGLAPKQDSCDGKSINPVPITRELELDACLQIAEGVLEEVSSKLHKASLDRSLLAERLKANMSLLKGVDEESRANIDTMSACKAEIARLRLQMEERVLEIHKCEIDMFLPTDDVLGYDHNADHAKFLASCSATNVIKEEMNAARLKYVAAEQRVSSLLPNMGNADNAGFELQSEIDKLKRTEANLTRSRHALSAECSKLKVLGKGSVCVRPISIFCPLQSMERSFPITECPVCSLGFYCNNWVPTPCGHCYHPSCLFSLFQIDDNKAPKCEACSEVFHPHWLQCWGLPQVNHPEVAKLVDDWGLEEQAKSFRLTLTDLYSKNVSGISIRRIAQDRKHKKSTKLYSREIIKEAIQYHETVGRAELAEYEVWKAKSKGHQTDGPSEVIGPQNDIVRIGREVKDDGTIGQSKVSGETSTEEKVNVGTTGNRRNGSVHLQKLDLSIVKKEKGAEELTSSIVECISFETQEEVHDTPSKKTKRKLNLGSGEIGKEGKDDGTIGQSNVSGDSRIEETVMVYTTGNKGNATEETGEQGKDNATAVQSKLSGETSIEEAVTVGTTGKRRRGVNSTGRSPSQSKLKPRTVVPASTMTRRSQPQQNK